MCNAWSQQRTRPACLAGFLMAAPYPSDGPVPVPRSRVAEAFALQIEWAMQGAMPRSLPDLEIVGCKLTAAVHFSPSFGPIAGLWGCKSDKNCPRRGQFSLRRSKSDSLLVCTTASPSDLHAAQSCASGDVHVTAFPGRWLPQRAAMGTCGAPVRGSSLESGGNFVKLPRKFTTGVDATPVAVNTRRISIACHAFEYPLHLDWMSSSGRDFGVHRILIHLHH